LKLHFCSFPDDLLYNADGNVWVRFDGTSATIGVTATLSWLTGPLKSVTFVRLGQEVEKERVVGSVEGPRHFDVVRTPLSCRTLTFNEELRKSPQLVNKDPYGKGWFATVLPSNLEEERQQLRSVGDIAHLLEERIEILGVHCFSEYPDHEMYEIGVECAAVLVSLGDLLSSSEIGTVVHVVSDDPTADLEMTRWSDQTGQALVESRKEGNLFHFIVRKIR
jgi:glycine cleavage system H lipoate-binding protein/TusA-related sulfurtransferase